MSSPGPQRGRAGFSIRARLVTAMVSLALVVIAAGSIATVQYDQHRLREQLRNEVSAISQALVQDFAKLLLLDSADQAAELVSKLRALPEVQGLTLRHRNGNTMLHFERVEGDARQAPDPALLVMDLPVIYQQVLLGTAGFTVAETRIAERGRSMTQLLAFLIPAMLLISVLLSFYLQRFFTRPLLRLTRAIRQVSQDHDYGLRLPLDEPGEYGDLYRGFNDMMARVEAASTALSEQTERLQVTLGSIGDGVLTTDRDGVVQYLNGAAERICGASMAQLLGEPVIRACPLQHASRQPLQHPIIGCMQTGEVVTLMHDCDLVRADGSHLPVQATAAPILGRDGVLVGAVMVLVDVSKARALAEELSYRASHDPLTDLHNRFALEQALQEVMTGARERQEQHALLFMDLDQFKIVNDSCGHAAGDALLKELARLFRSKMRAGDTLARMGGDEFAAILRHCPIANAVSVAEDIRNAVADYRFDWEGKRFGVGVSVGITSIDTEAADSQGIMSNADNACYEAKEAGRNRIYVYQPDDAALARRRGEVAEVARIRRALDEGRFELFGQPIMHTGGQACGCEVLIRMIDDARQRVTPAAFLSVAERYGLVEQLDRWVLAQVIGMLQSNTEPVTGLDFYAVNLSAASLGNADFTDYVCQLVGACPELGPRLCFEITETAAIRNLHSARDFMAALAGLGVRFALDDFGTGMSSLSYLKHLPVDMVKIDGSFVRDIARDPVDHGMVRAINDIAHLMNKRTVAEFVEDAEVLTRLTALGVDYAQGYHLGRPVPLAELASQINPCRSRGHCAG